MSITNIVIIIIVGFVLFEVIEHVIFPLAWYIVIRKRKPLCGIESMLGKEVMVKKWQKKTGWVYLNGELWRASSDDHLSPGDRVVIEKVEGLLLRVKPYNGS